MSRSQFPQVVAARRSSLRRVRWMWLLTMVVFVVTAAVAHGAELNRKRVTIQGASAPGPKRLHHVDLRDDGPSDAKTILILTPGSPGSQGNFARLAPWLVQRVPGPGVSAVDRRSNAL